MGPMNNILFAGIDIGGTKISAALVDLSGKILVQNKIATPEGAGTGAVLACLKELLGDLLSQERLAPSQLSGIGIGVPGIVDQKKNRILRTPNLKLEGMDLASRLLKDFPTLISLENDVNLGLLGERWLGAAKGFNHVVGVFPGTGIGGGLILNGELYTGTNGLAAEIGHMVIEHNGPECGCGNRGCLEALASRWAIERDIRSAIKKGEHSLVVELTEGDLSAIKSKVLKKALKAGDPVVTRIMKDVAETLAQACISLRHLFNPEMILFGGGIIEACGDFLLPIIEKKTEKDPFFAGLDQLRLVASKLGDDAVMLGAVALVKKRFESQSG